MSSIAREEHQHGLRRRLHEGAERKADGHGGYHPNDEDQREQQPRAGVEVQVARDHEAGNEDRNEADERRQCEHHDLADEITEHPVRDGFGAQQRAVLAIGSDGCGRSR